MVDVSLREVEERDHTYVSIVISTAFGTREEARLVDALRRTDRMKLELVAEDLSKGKPEIVGHIAFCEMDGPDGWWALAPVSVIRSRQRTGIGREMIRQGLDLCRRRKARGVVVVGDPAYYSRFGFSLKAAEGLISPYPAGNTLAYPIAPGAVVKGQRLIYPAAFSEV